MNVLAWMCVLHFVADGLLQSRKMGKNKSSDPEVLCQHVSIIFFVLFSGLLFLVPVKIALEVGAVNAFVHGLPGGIADPFASQAGTLDHPQNGGEE